MVLNTSGTLLLIASWVNLSLFTLEVGLATEYFRRLSRPILQKLGVASFLFFDTVCTVAIIVRAFFVAFVLPCTTGSSTSKETLTASGVMIISTYATASVCELYLISLHYALTKNRIISVLLILLVVVHLAFSYASAGLILAGDGVPSDIAYKTTIVGASTTAGTDVLIALFLCHKLIKMDRASVAGGSAASLIRRIIVIIITSGLIVATTTVVSLILLMQNSVAFPIVFFCKGRAYSLTILANFLLGIPRGSLSTETNISRRVDNNAQSAVVFRLQTYENTSPTASEPVQIPTKPVGHSNSLNSDPNHHNHFNRRAAIGLEETPNVDVKCRPDD